MTRGRLVGNEVRLEAGAASPDGGRSKPTSAEGRETGDVVVIASGNLAMVYFTRFRSG